MRNKLKFIMDGGDVKRYHTLSTLCTQTVAEHSFGVAWLCWLLTNGTPDAALIMAALQHDLAEHTTGDLPAPAKRRMGVGAHFDSEEYTALRGAGFPDIMLSDDNVKTLKLADIADLLLFCVKEARLGNRKMRAVYARGLSYVLEMEPLNETQRKLFLTIGELYEESE